MYNCFYTDLLVLAGTIPASLIKDITCAMPAAYEKHRLHKGQAIYLKK